jgi:hypothetical protein
MEVPKLSRPKREAKPKRNPMSRTERAALIASTSPLWELVSATPAVYRFQCVCGGWGESGYVLVPKGKATAASKAALVKAREAGVLPDSLELDEPFVKVGASCLYHFPDGK